jgi:hypothetical protein
MAIQTLGLDGTSVLAVDPAHDAARVSLRPAEVAGSFLVQVAGTTAAAPAAGANLISWRWGSATQLALVRRFRLEMMVTTASTAGIPEMACYFADGFTASDTGGTAVTLSGNTNKRRTSLAISQIASNGDFRFATGGVLTAGTRVLDTQPFMGVMAPLAVSTAPFVAEFGGSIEDEPIVFAQNEGIIVQNLSALTAAIYRYRLQIEWDEVLNATW